VAAYTAEIRIGVTGQRDLEQLRSSITQVNTAVDSLNRTRLNVGGLTQSLSNFQDQLARAARGLADVQLGSEGVTGALRNYVNALGAANTAQRDRNRLIEEEIRSRQGLQSLQDRDLEYWRRRNAVQSGRFRQQQLEEETTAAQRLAAELEDANHAWQMFEHLGKIQHTQELESAATAFEKFKNETVAGNNALERRIELSNQLGRIQQSVNTTQERLSVDNSAAMMRQATMARMYREQNPVGNTPLLPYGDPTLAAIRGGARRVGSQREIAGGARTQDEAAATLRWAQATQQLIAPLNQVDAILRGIAQETARISSTPLLPSSEMLNAGGRRIQRLQPTLLGPGTAAGEAGFRGAQRNQAEQTAAASAGAKRAESLALGVGFPLMFGAGPGMLAGSLAGSMFGSGFGGQILGGALGGKLDELGKQAGTTAEALRDPQNALAKLAEAGVYLGEKTDFAIKQLTESGRLTEAQALLQKKVADVVGTDGVYALQSLEEANKTLAIESGKLALVLQTELAPAFEFVAKIATESIRILLGPQIQRRAADINPQAYQRAQERASKEAGGSLFGGSTGKYESILNKLSEDIIRTTINPKQIKAAQLTPDSAEAQYQASLKNADTIKSAYREGFKLQQQAIDLQRQGADLQRRVAQDIFNKQQEILRLQIDNDRQRKQLAIELVDLEYKRRISNEEGRVAAVLEAEATYMRTRAQGEADIETKKRVLELDITKQKRDTEDYVYKLNRDIDSVRRATLNHEMSVVDYRLSIERQIDQERRVTAAAEKAAGNQANAAPAAFAPLSKLIGGAESYGGNYGAFNRGGTNQGHYAIGSGKDPNLVNMSIAEIQRRQLAPGVPANQQLHAVGKYQIIGDTLKSLLKGNYGPTGVKSSDKFTPDVQEELFAALAKNRIVPGNANKTMQGLRQEWIGLQNVPDAKLLPAIKTMMENKPSAATVEPQLTKASSKVVARPVVPLPSESAVSGQMQALDAASNKTKKETLSIGKQVIEVQNKANLLNIQQQTRGPLELQQRREALAYAKADLAVIKGGSTETQDRLSFEAQSAVKLKLIADENEKIKNATNKTKEVKDAELAGMAQKYTNTLAQIELDREALNIAQETRFAKEQAALQAQLGVTGTGLRAGFIGQAGQAFESEMLKSGDPAKAAMLAEQTQALELATTKARALESAYQDIGTAMASTLTEGVAGLVAGTTTAQQVFSDFLKSVGDALMKAAQQMIAQYLAIAAAKALAGLFGGGALGGGGAGGAADGSAFGATAFGGGVGGSAGFGMPSILGKAVGGPVAGGTPYMVGEKGPELFVPGSSGTIIPADTTAAMTRYQRQTASTGGAAGGAAGDAGASPASWAMNFETTQFLGQDWVSKDQLMAAMAATEKRATAAGAKAGAQQVATKMRTSPAFRRQVGV
jgi:hypothetical protein